MRRIGNLFDQVVAYENLLAAWHEVRRGKRLHHSVLVVDRKLPVVLERLRQEVIDGSYRPRPHRAFVLHDPKTRVIEAPHVVDRIVQHALVRVIRDPIEARLIRQTYACIRGRGTHAASEQLHRYVRQAPDARSLKMDVRKFFPSIHHDTLMLQLAHILKCERTLALTELFVRVGAEGRGLPIGATTSQILANLALSPVDHTAKRELGVRRYVRYMDDIVVVDASKARLREVMGRLSDVICGLHLEVNPKSGMGRVRDGVDFVGYRHFPGMKLIRKRSLYGIRKALMREPTLPRVMAYLSHAKNTASLPTVTRQCLKYAPMHKVDVWDWRVRHA